ncbi:tryptophan 2,3-dioxygenase [Micromonospora deserti]|uniref:Tryptophan 2,3-dioxygenase n=2 Tax=Micromonospora deserti TaxID=2070366 RepID=A0A2W2CTE3_9ACTN|nr:tryptophan 2,3-dioxygenase [Micromonospora deserti]
MEARLNEPLTEDARNLRALSSEGGPILEFGGENPFVSYVASNALLSLQNPRTESAGEPSFLITSQVMELQFKLASIEVARTRDLLDVDDVGAALWTLRRLRHVYSSLSSSWDVLSTLSPAEYGEFRDQLGEGSGFQSYMYREMEFVLGNKNPALAEAHSGDAQVYRRLQQRLSEPSLYDAALRLLWRRGLPVPDDCVERDWSVPYLEQEAVVEAWRTVYVERDKHRDLYLLAEALVDLAHDIARWRSLHLLTAERLLGAKVGTGGTTGADWLRRVADHRFFPELWMTRTRL